MDQHLSCVACANTHLVLDLDEVMVGHLTGAQFPDTHGIAHMRMRSHAANFRPDLRLFLHKCARLFKTVSVWTAGSREWLETFLAHLGPAHNCFLLTFSFRQCSVSDDGLLRKPLYRMYETTEAQQAGMQAHNTILVDDRETNAAPQDQQNLLLAQPFRFEVPCETLHDLLDRIVAKAVDMHQTHHARHLPVAVNLTGKSKISNKSGRCVGSVGLLRRGNGRPVLVAVKGALRAAAVAVVGFFSRLPAFVSGRHRS